MDLAGDMASMPVSVARVFIELALQAGMHASSYQKYIDEYDLDGETIGAYYDIYDAERGSAPNDDHDCAVSASGGDVDLEPRAAFVQPFTRFDDFRDWTPEERRRQNTILAQEQRTAERTAQDKADLEVR